jgi:hypothetical protein
VKSGRHLGAECLKNVGASTSRNRKGFQGLYKDNFTLYKATPRRQWSSSTSLKTSNLTIKPMFLAYFPYFEKMKIGSCELSTSECLNLVSVSWDLSPSQRRTSSLPSVCVSVCMCIPPIVASFIKERSTHRNGNRWHGISYWTICHVAFSLRLWGSVKNDRIQLYRGHSVYYVHKFQPIWLPSRYSQKSRGNVVGWDTTLQAVRSRVLFPNRLLGFSINLSFPNAMWP